MSMSGTLARLVSAMTGANVDDRLDRISRLALSWVRSRLALAAAFDGSPWSSSTVSWIFLPLTPAALRRST